MSPAAATFLATLLLLLAGCGNGEQSVQGIITEVQPRSLTEVATLTVRDDAGRLWTFETAGALGFTPSHLREHMLTGQPVNVDYEDEGERLLAVRVTD